MKKNILIIDDDTYICSLLDEYLSGQGYNTDTAFTGSKGLNKINDKAFDLVLCDYRLPDNDGLTILQGIRKLAPQLPVIIITAYADVQQAVRLIKAGAFDYVTKPIRPEEITTIVKSALRKRRSSRSKERFEKEFIIGESPQMNKVLELAKVVAPTDMTVLIEGETGTGKEYISRAIHYNSKRKDKPFVAVDCGAIPHELANSELFGHVRGSFTGAIKDKEGSFQAAESGTLFLDEIGNLPYEVQVKLLRVLQERVVNRVGENKNIEIDVRIIAASNEPLLNMVKENKFRDDLYHRINEFKINVPPLRERSKDILIFAEKFREEANEELEKDVQGFSKEVKSIFMNHRWLGNFRELRNMIKRAVLLAKSDEVLVEDLPEDMLGIDSAYEYASIEGDKSGNLKEAAVSAEKKVILNTLEKADYNKSKAAKLLNIDRKTLYNKLKQFGIALNKTS